MSIKNSLANKRRWAKVSPKTRSARMSKLAKIKQSQLSPKEKREHALKMIKARDGL